MLNIYRTLRIFPPICEAYAGIYMRIGKRGIRMRKADIYALPDTHIWIHG